MVLEFDTTKTMSYLEIAQKSKLTRDQEHMMNVVCQSLCSSIPTLSEMVIKGMFRLAARDFVKTTGIEIKDLTERPVKEVSHHIRWIFDNIADHLCKMLRRSNDETMLRNAMDDAYNSVISMIREMQS